MRTSFLRFALGFLAIVALAIMLIFVLGALGAEKGGNSKTPAAVEAVEE